MNLISAIPVSEAGSPSRMGAMRAKPAPLEQRSAAPPRGESCRWELTAFAVLIALVNAPLLAGHFSAYLLFLPHAVQAGEWWRLFTHPFVHLSGYHLAFDAAAFLLVYAELRGFRRLERLGLVGLAAAGSLLVTLGVEPGIWENGLCGLSGIAHGLTALAGLELARQQQDKLLRYGGLLCFCGVVAKVILEAATGQVLLASWHLGDIGTPMASSHTGGVLGALVGVWVISLRKTGPRSRPLR